MGIRGAFEDGTAFTASSVFFYPNWPPTEVTFVVGPDGKVAVHGPDR
jgi:hypothetical protein